MKTRKYCSAILIVFILLTFGCKNTSSEKENNKIKSPSSSEIDLFIKKEAESKRSSNLWKSLLTKSHASFSAKINDDLPEFNFKIVGHIHKFNEYEEFIPSYVEVRNASDGKFIQKMIVGDIVDKNAIGYGEDSGMIQLVDLNFDGYLDFRILLYRGATGCNSYASFLYNPALKKFVFNKQLSDMSALRVDAESKQLTTYDRGGYCDELIRHYEVRDNKFMLTKAEWTIIKNVNTPCYKITGIPIEGHSIFDTDNYDFLDSKGRLRKKLKIVKKEELHGSLDGRHRNAYGIPSQ